MPTVYFGRRNEPGFTLDQGKDLIAVRTRSRRPLTRSIGSVASPAFAELDDATLSWSTRRPV